jgi:hypothetical protein
LGIWLIILQVTGKSNESCSLEPHSTGHPQPLSCEHQLLREIRSFIIMAQFDEENMQEEITEEVHTAREFCNVKKN